MHQTKWFLLLSWSASTSLCRCRQYPLCQSIAASTAFVFDFLHGAFLRSFVFSLVVASKEGKRRRSGSSSFFTRLGCVCFVVVMEGAPRNMFYIQRCIGCMSICLSLSGGAFEFARISFCPCKILVPRASWHNNTKCKNDISLAKWAEQYSV